MSDPALVANMQALLSRDDSVLRVELTTMAFDALMAQPAALFLSDETLLPTLLSALTTENVERLTQEHGLPLTLRVGAHLAAAEQHVRDLLPEAARGELERIIAAGPGPRFGWLKGALDPADLRELFAPVVQQVLVQFTSKLPIPGVGGAGAGPAASAALGGLVGMLGKQMQKSASQFAEVGKSVMGGLGSELERRMHTFARDFSHTAMGEFRAAVVDRLASPEGQAILVRMRDRVVRHVFDAKLADVAQDLMRLPMAELAQVGPQIVVHQGLGTLLPALLASETHAAIAVLGERTLADLLREANLLDSARSFALRRVDQGAQSLFASDAFGAWLGRLLNQAAP